MTEKKKKKKNEKWRLKRVQKKKKKEKGLIKLRSIERRLEIGTSLRGNKIVTIQNRPDGHQKL